jgi:hypothetical protein
MIGVIFTSFVLLPPQNFGQLDISQCGQVLTNGLLHVCADHLKEALSFMTGMTHKLHKFSYAEFHSHWHFSFLFWMSCGTTRFSMKSEPFSTYFEFPKRTLYQIQFAVFYSNADIRIL